MLIVNDTITIPDGELTWTFARSGGPGGQNVNKVSSKAQLRWAMKDSPSVTLFVKERLAAKHPSRVTLEGDFLVMSQESRVQERNRELCLEKLAALILEATIVPKTRRVSKPSKASKARRVDEKKRNATRKSARKVNTDD